MNTHIIKQLFCFIAFTILVCLGSTIQAAEDEAEAPTEETLSESVGGETGAAGTSESVSSSGEPVETNEGEQAVAEGEEPPVGEGEDETQDDLYQPKNEQPKEAEASAKTVTVANTGAASYSYPLNLPPARGAAIPQLSINYNSQSRSKGVLGFGFGLGIPSIQRSTKRGLNYDENSSGFIANGQELISREHTWGPLFFGAKFETTFTRYQYARDNTTKVASWLGTTREGIKYYYGSTEASRQQFEAGVFKWYVDRIEDTNGNFVVYNYEKDQGTVYLKSITYSHHAHKDPMYMVMLHYDEQGGDQRTVSYETHYPTKKRWRLGVIDIVYGTSAEPVRKYQFHYDDWCTAGVCGDDTIGLSFLTAIEQIEFRKTSGTYFEVNHATTEFEWPHSKANQFTNLIEFDYPKEVVQNDPNPDPSPDGFPNPGPFDPEIDQTMLVFDYDGDNRDDFLYYQFGSGITINYGDNQQEEWQKPGETYIRIFRSTGDGYEEVTEGQSIYSIFGRNFPEKTEITAFDFDGDNRDDLLFRFPDSIHNNKENVWLYRSQYNANSPTAVLFDYVKSYDSSESLATFGNFRRTNASMITELPDGSPPIPRARKSVPSSSISPTDFNGDGKADLLIVHKEDSYVPSPDGGHTEYYYKLQIVALQSTGNENGFIPIDLPLDSDDGLTPIPIYIDGFGDEYHTFDARTEVLSLDVNGDGYSDIITLIEERLRVSLAQVDSEGNVEFVSATNSACIVGPFPEYPGGSIPQPITQAHGRRLHPMDYNGDGYTDLLIGAAWWDSTPIINGSEEDYEREYVLFRYDVASKEFVPVRSKSEVFFKVTPYNFNDDGRTDLLVDCGQIRVSNGDGTFKTVKNNLAQWIWGWECDDTGGPWGGDYNYSNSTFTPVDFDGNGIQEIYFEGNFHRYPRFYSPVDPVIQNEFTQRYYRSMIRGWMNNVPYLMNKVTTTYGCGVWSCSDKYHHRVDVTYGVSSGVHDNQYMPQIVSLVTEVVESYGTNVPIEAIKTKYEYKGARHFPEDREFGGYGVVTASHQDDSFEETQYHLEKDKEFRRGRTWRHTVYVSRPTEVDPFPDRSTTVYRWVGTELNSHGEGLFVRLEREGDKPAKIMKIVDGEYHVSIHENYTYDIGNVNTELDNGMVKSEVSRLVEHNLPDDVQVESVTKQYAYGNFDDNGWVWRKTEEYLIGEIGGVVISDFHHVHRATIWDFEPDTGNVAYQWLMGSADTASDTKVIETHWQYDNFGNVKLERDPNGNVSTYEYEDGLAMFYKEIRQPLTTNVVSGTKTIHLLSFSNYDYKHGKPTIFTDENGYQTNYAYDYLGRTISVVRPHYPAGEEETTKYADDIDNAYPRYLETTVPTEASDNVGDNQIIRTYIDGAGRVLQTVAQGETVNSTVRYVSAVSHYDEMGRKTKGEGPYFCDTNKYYPMTACKSDVWTRQNFDYLNRITRVDASGSIESTAEHYGLMTRYTDPDGKIKRVYKDHRGNIVKIEQDYDGDMPGTQVTTYLYNAADDLLAIRRQDKTAQVSYQNEFVYDLFGRTVQSFDPDIGNWSYEYDNNSNLIKQTDANGVVLTITYDELDRKTQEFASVPKRGSASYALAWGIDRYYEEGDTVRYNDNVYVADKSHWSSSSSRPPLDDCIWNVLTDWSLNEYYCAGTRVGHNGLVYQSMLGHYASQEWEPGIDNTMWQLETEFETKDITTFTYDEGANGVGQPHTAQNSDDSFTTFAAYDESGRLLEATKHVSGAPDLQGYTTTTEYDLAGKTKTVTYPDGYKLYYTYHPGTSLVRSVSENEDTSEAKLAMLDSYQADGKIGRMTLGWASENDYATRTTYHYETLTQRLKSIYTTNQEGEPIQNKEYGYSPSGDVEFIKDHRTNMEYTYEYDDFHRLVAEKHKGVEFTGNDFITLVNMFEKARPHAPRRTLREQSGQPTSHYEYDNNGNLIRVYNQRTTSGGTIRSGSKRIEYNAKNMPTRIENYDAGYESVTEFGYDPDYERVRKTVVKDNNVSTTIYISDGYEVKTRNVGELDEEVETVKYVFAGTVRVAKVSFEGLFYIHKDHLGSTSAVTNSMGEYPDGEPEYTEYQPFGLPRPGSAISSKTDYGFTDQEFDRSTGFYNYDARLYNPEIGMFITADSILPDYYDPQQLNRYAYSRNNPIKYTDPDGHIIFCLTAISVGAILADTALVAAFVTAAVATVDIARKKMRAPSAPIKPIGGGGNTVTSESQAEHINQARKRRPTFVAPKQSGKQSRAQGQDQSNAKNSEQDSSETERKEPVKPGDKGTYGELKAQKKKYGETEPMDMDHRPSFAAQVKARENQLGRPLNKEELKALKDNSPAVATPRRDHQQKSRTYGGRNNKVKINEDAQDLEKAAELDDAAYEEE